MSSHLRFVLAAALLLALPASASADQVIPDDLIVQGHTCVGLDCVNNEDFGLEDLKLKHDNVRMLFEDTSVMAGFPTNDWRFTFNDQANGGASYFGLDDVTGSTTPFKVLAGAATNAMVLSATANLGLGTSAPALDLHVSTGDTPAIRMEQTNAGGFTPQTWDIGANEANWFVRDLTAGSRLVFRIRPGAPTSSLDIKANGDIGLGTASPAAALHLTRADGTAQVKVEDTSATEATRVLADLVNKGAPQLRFSNATAGATSWLAGPSSGAFVLKTTAGSALDALRLDGGGDATVAGVLQQNATPAAVENAAAATPADILAAIKTLPISRFEYVEDGSNAKHLAPSGAEFRAALGLGGSDNALAPADLASAALAGVQALAADTSTTTLATRMGTAEGQLTSLGGRLGAVETSLAAAGVNVSGHSTTLKTLKTAHTRLSERVTSLSKRNTVLSKRNTALDKRLRRLERMVRKLD